jgi:ribose 1,5-bisphosphokinase PhnN
MSRVARTASTRRGGHGSPVPIEQTGGQFVILASARPACRDLVLQALKRRLAGEPSIRFPIVAVAAPSNAPAAAHGALALSRRQFAAFEADGVFAAVWSDHGVQTGLPRSALDGLSSGATLIVSGPPALAVDLRKIAARTDVVAVHAELDRVRQPLSPRACLSRLAAGKVRDRLRRVGSGELPTAEVAVGVDLGRSLAALTTAIMVARA